MYVMTPSLTAFQLWAFPHVILILFPVLILLCRLRRWRFTTRDLLLFVLVCALVFGITGRGVAQGWRALGGSKLVLWWFDHSALTGFGALIVSALATALCWRCSAWSAGQSIKERK